MTDTTSQIGSSKSTPLRLSTLIHVPANHSIWTQCETPVHMRYQAFTKPFNMILDCNAPIELFADRAFDLEPRSLMVDFKAGWHKLPTELKLDIVTQIIRFERSVPSGVHVMMECKERFFHCLRLTPEIAALAKEVYYSKNTHKIHPLLARMQIPNATVGHLIRKIEFDLKLHLTWPPTPWDFLQRLAKGNYGMPNLNHIVVIAYLVTLPDVFPTLPILASGNWDRSPALDQVLPGSTSFECAGETRLVETLSWHAGSLASRLNVDEASIERLRSLMRDKISFRS